MPILFLTGLFLLSQGRTDFLGPVLFFCLPVLIPVALFALPLLTGDKK